MSRPWTLQVGKRAYAKDPSRFGGIVVEISADGETVTLDTGAHEGLMPRYIDHPVTGVCGLAEAKKLWAAHWA